MARRFLLPLLCVLALVAAGAWWIARPREWSSAEAELAAESVSPDETTPDASDAPRSSALEWSTADATYRGTPEAPHRESAALAVDDAELADAIWVEGHVVIPDGTPADESVEVIADGAPFASRPDYRAPIGADGAYRVAFAKGTRSGALAIDARYLYLDAPRTIDLGSGRAEPGAKTTLRPRLGGWIRGRIVLHPSALALRASAERWRVRLNANRFVRVDSELAFEFRGAPVGGYTVSVDASPLVEVSRKDVVVAPAGVQDVELALQLGATIAGDVVDTQGRPMEQARVRAHRAGSGGGGYMADGTGQFRIEGLAPGAVKVMANAEGCSVSEAVELDLQPGQVVDGLHFVLGRGARLAGKVLGPDGQPVQLAEVRLVRRKDAAWAHWEAGVQGTLVDRTDKAGAFVFENLAAGTYALEASVKANREEFHVSELDAGKDLTLQEGDRVDGVEVQLRAGCRAEGVVTDADGRPVVRARVWARIRGGAARRSTTANTDSTGRFAMANLVPGEWTFWAQQGLQVSAPTKPVVIDARATATVDLRMQAGTMLHVAARDVNGAAVADAAISVVDEREDNVSAWPASSAGSGAADGPGGRSFGPLASGRYVVTARAGTRVASRTVELSGQPQEAVTLELPP